MSVSSGMLPAAAPSVKGMMQGKLKLKGNLPYMVKYLKGVQESIRCLTEVDSKWPDE